MKSKLSFDEFKLNSDGMIPVITQDYKTNEVLMLAYMTKESFEKTLETGKMTYFSRSRQELWTKGDTSGHYQYVKSLDIDCDKDTILAKLEQPVIQETVPVSLQDLRKRSKKIQTRET